MNFNPGREAFVDGVAVTDPRTALVCEVAAGLYGPAWRFSLASEFAIDPDEIDDCIAGRTEIPDFLLVGLLHQVRVRTVAYAAVSLSLATEVAMAPDGDYSFPDALARNARIVIRERDPQSLQYDNTLDEYCFREAAEPNEAASSEYHEPRVSARDRI